MTAVAILTYNRLQTLKKVLASVMTHNRVEDIAVFEDCGQSDGTRQWLTSTTKKVPQIICCCAMTTLSSWAMLALHIAQRIGPQTLDFFASVTLLAHSTNARL